MYLGKAGEHKRMLAVARQCPAQPWECAALVGFALHVNKDFAGSDTAFTAIGSWTSSQATP